METLSPRYVALHKVFWRQNWRLFAYTQLYNRQMNVIIRSSHDTTAADTTDLVQYSLTQKRRYAPFNNYEDGLDRVLYTTMNLLESRLEQYKKGLKTKSPGHTDEFYMLQASSLVETDTVAAKNMFNLDVLAKKMLQENKVDTSGKEYQLMIIHKYIPPQKPADSSYSKGNQQFIFQTRYKQF